MNTPIHQHGFTLIEMMIVLAIIGILAAIAVPQFQRFSAQSKRSEGIAILSGLHLSEMSYFASEGTHPTLSTIGMFPASLGYTLSSAPKFYYVGGTLGVQVMNATQGDVPPVHVNAGKGYAAFLTGNLDADSTLDYLCVHFPAPNPPTSNFCCTTGLFDCNGRAGEVLVSGNPFGNDVLY